MSEDFYDDDERYDEYPEPNCFECNDTGRVVAADGYHEYLGYDYLPCSVCHRGLDWVGKCANDAPMPPTVFRATHPTSAQGKEGRE